MNNTAMARKIHRAIKKKIRQQQQSDEFYPFCINLKLWCESAGIPDHYDWILDKINSECQKDEELFDLILFNGDGVICLNVSGISVFRGILSEFFGDDEVRQVLRYLRLNDEYYRILHDMNMTIHALSDEKLSEIFKTWTEAKNDYRGEKIDTFDRILGLISSELRKRHPVKALADRLKMKMPTGCSQ